MPYNRPATSQSGWRAQLRSRGLHNIRSFCTVQAPAFPNFLPHRAAQRRPGVFTTNQCMTLPGAKISCAAATWENLLIEIYGSLPLRFLGDHCRSVICDRAWICSVKIPFFNRSETRGISDFADTCLADIVTLMHLRGNEIISRSAAATGSRGCGATGIGFPESLERRPVTHGEVSPPFSLFSLSFFPVAV